MFEYMRKIVGIFVIAACATIFLPHAAAMDSSEQFIDVPDDAHQNDGHRSRQGPI